MKTGLPVPLRAAVEQAFFNDKNGNWWSTYFGSDSQSPWRERPDVVKIDFDTITDEQVQKIEEKLNNRPRKRLGFQSPLHTFEQLAKVALAT